MHNTHIQALHLLALLLTTSMILQSAASKELRYSSSQIPEDYNQPRRYYRDYGQYNPKTGKLDLAPLNAHLQAAYTGELATWSPEQIAQASSTRHPLSDDTIAHLACDPKTLETALKACPHLLFQRNKTGKTPIHIVASFSKTNCPMAVQAIITHLQEQYPNNSARKIKLYFQQKDNNGNTFAHLAARHDQIEALALLRAHGIDFSIANNTTETPDLVALNYIHKKGTHARLHRFDDAFNQSEFYKTPNTPSLSTQSESSHQSSKRSASTSTANTDKQNTCFSSENTDQKACSLTRKNLGIHHLGMQRFDKDLAIHEWQESSVLPAESHLPVSVHRAALQPKNRLAHQKQEELSSTAKIDNIVFSSAKLQQWFTTLKGREFLEYPSAQISALPYSY